MERAPLWFTAAIATPLEHTFVDVDGCPIHYVSWGRPGRPGLVLVHGGAAHVHWWSFLAPLLANEYHVVALDLSGHGDSGRRDEYPREVWAKEVITVARVSGIAGRPILVGHSMGGLVAVQAASLYGDLLDGAVIIDAPVRRPDPESVEGSRGKSFRNPKTYPDIASALSRFRLVPPQPCDNGYIIDHIAMHSIREVEGGWTWKFDPVIFQSFFPKAIHEYLADVHCRVALFRAEFSVVVDHGTAEYMYELLDRAAPVVEIPQAHHHLLLDQPLAFVAALRAILADWEHSVPRHSTA